MVMGSLCKQILDAIPIHWMAELDNEVNTLLSKLRFKFTSIAKLQLIR